MFGGGEELASTFPLMFLLPAPARLQGHSAAPCTEHCNRQLRLGHRLFQRWVHWGFSCRDTHGCISSDQQVQRESGGCRREVVTAGPNWKCSNPGPRAPVAAAQKFPSLGQTSSGGRSHSPHSITTPETVPLLVPVTAPSLPTQQPSHQVLPAGKPWQRAAEPPSCTGTAASSQLWPGNSSGEAAPCSNNLLWFPARGGLSNCNT